MFEDFYFFGDNTFKKRLILIKLIRLLNIVNDCTFSASGIIYYIFNNRVFSCKVTPEILRDLQVNRKEMSIKEVYNLLYTTVCNKIGHPWWLDLDVGDTVTIAERYGECYEYPIFFTDDICDFSGKSFMIERLLPKYFSIGSSSLIKSMSNGDPSCYILNGCRGYLLHSSMFVSNDTNPIKKISLTEIPLIEKLIL